MLISRAALLALAIALAGNSLAWATGTASTNYSIPTSTLNAGVGDMTSASYRLSSSLGDPFFTGSEASASYRLAHGLWISVGVPVLDVDLSLTATKYDALTDGVLVLRYLRGLTGTSLTTSALGTTATRTDPETVKAYLDGIRGALDIDGNNTADALTDGLLIIRYLFGLRGDVLIAGAVDPLGTRTTAGDIETYIRNLMPE